MTCFDRRAIKRAPKRYSWQRLTRALPVGFLCWITGGFVSANTYDASVFRIEAVHDTGGVSVGSAVLVAPGVLLTNCHVIQQAEAIQVTSRFGKTWRATLDSGDAYRDICALRVPNIEGEIVERAPALGVYSGLKVHAVGFSGRRFKVSDGLIKALHPCVCDGGKVIQTSAQFDPGASGGGLFDAEGRLIGMLTFKNRRGGDFYFAVPIAWYGIAAINPPAKLSALKPFWQVELRQGNLFLTACALSAEGDWEALRDLAEGWKLVEPGNPEPWLALGRAEVGMVDFSAARRAFKTALDIDSTHADAIWELQKLDLETQ